MAEPHPPEDRPKTPEEDSKKKEEEQKRAEKEKRGKELVIELKVSSDLAKEVKQLVKNGIYEAKSRDGQVLSEAQLTGGDFVVGLRNFTQFIVKNTKTGQEFEVFTTKKVEDTRQTSSVAKKILDGIEYQIEFDARGREISRSPISQEPVVLEDSQESKWIIDPKTGYKIKANPMAGGALDDTDLPYVPGMPKDEMQKLVNQQIAEALAKQVAEQTARQNVQQGLNAFTPENFQASWVKTKQMFPSTPDWNPAWQNIYNADAEDIYNFRVANNIPIMPTADQLDRMGMKLPPDSGRQTEVEQHARHFKEIYNQMISQGYLAAAGDPKSVDDLNSDDREKFFANLQNINNGECDMNQILQKVAETPEFIYPGQELAVVLRIDKRMGLGGDLVRRAVEQRMAVEEYDDSKQMRQETVGALHNAIGQYLGSEPALQQELRLLVYVRMKLHEFTILARYVGVDKLADQMSNFYQDEFRVIMDTRLFKEATQMLESEYGAYFRKGRGFENRDVEYKHKRSERYEKNTIKMALLLMPELKDNEWKNHSFASDTNARDTAIYAARKFVEKTNLYRRDRKPTDQGLDRQATWDEILDEMVRENKLSADKKQELKDLLEKKSTLARMVTPTMSFDQAYRVTRTGFDTKDSEDGDTQKNTPMNTVIDKVNLEKAESLIGRRLTPLEKQNLVNIYNEANRAFGLSIRVFDIYGASTKYDCLLDKKGVIMKPKTAILKFPPNLTWVHIIKEAEYSRPYMISIIPELRERILREYPELANEINQITSGSHNQMETAFNAIKKRNKSIASNISDAVDDFLKTPEGKTSAQKAITPILAQLRDKSVDLAKLDDAEDAGYNLSKADYEGAQMLKVVRGLSAKTIRDTRTRAMREMIFNRWDEIDQDDSGRGYTSTREFKKAMWNQTYKSGMNADTPGKRELLKYTSTDIVSLYEDNGRTSVWDQMSHWDDDFANMKKWCEELKVGNTLRKNYAEGDPGMFNSTTKLNDPVESLKKYKDMIGDWTQEHRVEFLDFLSQAPIEYIVKHNHKNAGYKNADVVRAMNLMNEMFWNSVMSPKKKKEIEARYYGGHYLAHIQYGAKKGHWFQGIFGFIGDIFKESVKGLTK